MCSNIIKEEEDMKLRGVGEAVGGARGRRMWSGSDVNTVLMHDALKRKINIKEIDSNHCIVDF